MEGKADILVINGPNLNMLGKREPSVYGYQALAEIEAKCRDLAAARDMSLDWFTSNSEGALIDRIHDAVGNTDWIIINAAGLTHTSVALSDALSLFPGDLIEVHISNIHARESFRHVSLISPVAKGVIVGFGAASYYAALDAIAHITKEA